MGGEMTTLDRLIILCNTYAIRVNAGKTLSEDEALFYFAALNYLRRCNQVLELNLLADLDKLEAERKPDDDEDDGAGRSAPITPSPS